MRYELAKMGKDDVILAYEQGSGQKDGDPEDIGSISLIPLSAVASWGELLGMSDSEALDAIIQVRGSGEPAPDPETGRNAWTDAYEQIESEAASSEDYDAAAYIRSISYGPDRRARTRAALGLSPVGVQAMAANVASADDGGKSVVLSDAADGIAALRRGFVDDIRRLHDNP